MKLFADTASLKEIEYCFSRGVNDGITTNPKIMEATGDLSLGFEGACRAILTKYPHVPVSLETDLRGIDVKNLDREDPRKIRDILLEQALRLSSWAPNVVVKIPICNGGLLAAEQLALRGIKTNVTACMTPEQAIRAASVADGYVSLFANRMLDTHILELAGYRVEDILGTRREALWKEALSKSKEEYAERAWDLTLQEIAYVSRILRGNPRVSLIVGSIRTPKDIYRLAQASPQVITIPTKIVEGLENIEGIKDSDCKINISGLTCRNLSHPMTQYTLEEFERAADAYRKS